MTGATSPAAPRDGLRLPAGGRFGRLHLITDTRPGRDPIPVVEAALAAGVRTIQVRPEDHLTDREAYQLTLRVLELCTRYDAVCLVNDRLHVAVAAGAHGGHVGADDLPVVAARRVLGESAVLGATARDPDTGTAHVAAGASYLGVGPAYATATKDGLPAAIGVEGVAAVARAVPVPVIAIGGITADRAAALIAAGAYGVAVVSAISEAAEPYDATVRLLRAIEAAARAPDDGRAEGGGAAAGAA